jgi:sulfur relay (sulfurtransferase) DsrF/TusC family protein
VPPTIVVIIREDPVKTPRAVEALRIALGLGTGSNSLTVLLLDRAPLLLSGDLDAIEDGDILEKHLPVFKELGIPFVLQQGAQAGFKIDSAFNTREASEQEMIALVAQADRILTF